MLTTASADGVNSDQQVQPHSASQNNGNGYTIEQTLSDEAQRNTIAFDGLAFLTGSLGADSFLPPGKVADFWGFQYLRDNDPSQMGHNTDFLTRAANNVLYILTDSQVAELVALAEGQVGAINQYAYDRFALMEAFRRLLEGDLPEGANALDRDAVKVYSAQLYRLDGEISFQRAEVMGGILHSLTADQLAHLDAMVGQGMTSWPDVGDQLDPRDYDRDVHVAVMTYAGDIFSWYAGSVEADVYFCPERQGTYFGSFYLKDAPAMGNPDYTIDSNLTAEMGSAFLAALTADQAKQVTGLVDVQRDELYEIVETREQVATELRRFMAGETPDSGTVLSLMERYGELDGEIVYNYATTFAEVGHSLSSDQEATLANLRADAGVSEPVGAYLYSEPIAMPEIADTDFLFGQDDQHDGDQSGYVDNGDGTVSDPSTGIMWQQVPESTKVASSQAVAYCQPLSLAGYSDWRLPTVTELYSLIDHSTGWPYIDTSYFTCELDPVESKNTQYWSSTNYVSTTHGGQATTFGVNFATGHIKGYPSTMNNYVRCARGGSYGGNSFADNGDGTVTDGATGLMWQQADDGVGRDWEDALASCENLTLAGYDDWRLPSAKELQFIVDYTRMDPAIDPVFTTVDGLGWFWTSTPAYHSPSSPSYDYAWYVAFGKATDASGDDLHGSGAVRFDPKSEGIASIGGDESRVYNYARCVRGGSGESPPGEEPPPPPDGEEPPPPPDGEEPPPPPDGEEPPPPPPDGEDPPPPPDGEEPPPPPPDGEDPPPPPDGEEPPPPPPDGEEPPPPPDGEDPPPPPDGEEPPGGPPGGPPG